METQDTARAELSRFKSDVDYFEAHLDDLLARYPGEWVAIYNGAVAGAAPRIEDLLVALAQKGVPPARALVRHVTRHEDTLILPS